VEVRKDDNLQRCNGEEGRFYRRETAGTPFRREVMVKQWFSRHS